MKQTKCLAPTISKENGMLVDAEGKTLGRLATQVASVLRGKHNPSYTSCRFR